MPQHLCGGEPIAVLNMTPEGFLAFKLPRVTFAFTTHFATREESHEGKLVGVTIDAEEKRLMMSWQSALPVKAPEADYLDVTVVEEVVS